MKPHEVAGCILLNSAYTGRASGCRVRVGWEIVRSASGDPRRRRVVAPRPQDEWLPLPEGVEALLLNPKTIPDELKRLERQDPTEGDLTTVDWSIARVERPRKNLLGNLGLLDPDSAVGVRQQLADANGQLKGLQAEHAGVLA